MVTDLLKKETGHLHDMLEGKMDAGRIMDGTLDFAAYKRILVINYWVHKALEPIVYDTLTARIKEAVHAPARLKTHALTLDLGEAGLDPAVIDEHSPLFDADDIAVKSEAYKLGGMYVLEGATLGGKVIVRKLEANATLKPYNLHYYYYNIYEDTGAQWKHFTTGMNGFVGEGHEREALEGAERMYRMIARAADFYDGMQHKLH